MNRFAQIVVISTMCMIAMSCIRESLPPCPSLSISLTVKDKNYFNIDDAVKLGLMERKADSLPFREYIHSIIFFTTKLDRLLSSNATYRSKMTIRL